MMICAHETNYQNIRISPVPHPEKEKIVAFMKSGEHFAHAPMEVWDITTGETVDIPMQSFKSDELFWTNMDTYNFERHDMELSQEFIESAMALVDDSA